MLSLFKRAEKVFAPATGILGNLKDVDDEIFSQGLMGPGLAILLGDESTEIFAPVSGTVAALYPTGHALGIKTKRGYDLLLHVGLESFRKKDLIKKYVRVGDEVGKGQILLALNNAAAEPKDRILLMTFPNLAASLKSVQSCGAVEASTSLLFEIE